MILEACCQLALEAATPVPAIFMLRPRSGWGQWVMREEYVIEPHLPMIEYTDDFGNLCQRAVLPAGHLSLLASCVVDTADRIDVQRDAAFVPIDLLPDPILKFLLPSRYCQADQLADLAKSIAGNIPPGYGQAETVTTWIHQNVTYRYGTSNASTSALETARSHAGVCRDMAHLGIALCRALNIPARFVSGFLHELDPMDLHAWFEAYVGTRWFTFDATQAAPKGNRIAIAYGRDAADVALLTQFGPLNLREIRVSVGPRAAA
ncbi:MAG: transglutaminase family protein [Terrimicrobiaceae bacterium]|nr:transglutaminase family protein [Terrimicrobiaceae bacterium]